MAKGKWQSKFKDETTSLARWLQSAEHNNRENEPRHIGCYEQKPSLLFPFFGRSLRFDGNSFRLGLGQAGRGRKVAIGIARVVVVIGEGIPMLQEIFYRFDRNGKTETFTESQLHIGNADHLTPHVEQWAAAVARIDLRRGLQIKRALELARLGAHDSLGDGAFEAQGASNRKDPFTHSQIIRIPQNNPRKMRSIFIIDLQQGKVLELVHGDNADLFVIGAFQLP